MQAKKISLPLTDDIIKSLHAGDSVLLSGTVYTGRDDAHLHLVKMLEEGKPLPIELKGLCIYYVGPCPAKPGRVIGPAGPTTSGRMDAMTPVLLDNGMKGMIGKGLRSKEVIESMKKNCCVYFASIGGAGALLSNQIKKAEIVAFPELGPEAIYKLEVEDFPVTVVIDCEGNNLYETGRQKYAKEN